jgi:alpha-L-arabinofuranosidase
MSRSNQMTRLLILLLSQIWPLQSVRANHQDTVYLFAHAINQGRGGLAFAWSLNEVNWHAIGQDHLFLQSDFGTWGSQKKMFDPFLLQDQEGVWHCLWTLNDETGQLAHAASDNLFDWKRQSYPLVMPGGNVHEIEASCTQKGYLVSWMSVSDEQREFYSALTKDFKEFALAEQSEPALRQHLRREIDLEGTSCSGVVNRVPWELVEGLIRQEEWVRFHEMERAERMADDPVRFNGLRSLDAVITPHPGQSKPISDMLVGVFFEDINYAADGGLYAELIQNRGFEYQPGDRDFRDSSWHSKKAWAAMGDLAFSIDTVDPIHPNNPHYAALNFSGREGILVNEGWDGIALRDNEPYDFSFFARAYSAEAIPVQVVLRAPSGRIAGESRIELSGLEWKKYMTVIQVSEGVPDASLEIHCPGAGRIDLDMISLFPRNTYRNRKNGMRADLARVIEEMNPRFIRFPGGCVAHGDGLANMYRWENTIGPLESRVPQRNIWNYHQSAGLGYYEYFQFCEDIGAEPLPVVPAGVPCQNSHTGGYGQQCGIPMGEMDAYVQSVLNLIEWANGKPDTPWGRKRAEAGHPEPFHLKYLGVGNEDQITDVFEERYRLIVEAIRENHPEITVIGTAGPFSSGTDYDEGWDLARNMKLPMVDEHYYQTPGWFINNQDFYDRYDRDGAEVYLGEYAAHVPGRRNNMEAALSEALYLTSLERNGDVVRMASYAPLLAKEGHTNWNPDLIYFNNTEVKPTVNYYVQQMYGLHSGNRYVPSTVNISRAKEAVRERLGVSLVEDEESGYLILKLVNLLPVEINAVIDMDAFDLHWNGVVTVLQGEPADEDVQPVKTTIPFSPKLSYLIPEYSFSVIRFQAK